MLDEVRAELAPTGVLRAGINLSNFLLVTGKSAGGEPEGVSPSMAAEVARRLDVEVQYVTFKTPGELADAAVNDVWDIGLIGAEPARAEHISFSAAYSEIEATYLVPAGSSIQTLADVDQPGIKIAVPARAAFELWLTDNIQHAQLHRAPGRQAFDDFVEQKMDALAGLRAGLVNTVEELPGSRLLDGQFTAVQQAIGTPKGREVAAEYLRAFVEEAKSSGFVADLIEQFGVDGRLTVAPAA
ncbi:MAG: transporter substrate-binding domain-containing protein [Pseudomonadales bacterium]|nr:transporter substrate-binding domain-containing protein [Pseudomonadales bacterium]